MSARHAGSYEYLEGRYIVGEIPADAAPCFVCMGSGLDYTEEDGLCLSCYGSGVEE